jgi:hypothetical protein
LIPIACLLRRRCAFDRRNGRHDLAAAALASRVGRTRYNLRKRRCNLRRRYKLRNTWCPDFDAPVRQAEPNLLRLQLQGLPGTGQFDVSLQQKRVAGPAQRDAIGAGLEVIAMDDQPTADSRYLETEWGCGVGELRRALEGHLSGGGELRSGGDRRGLHVGGDWTLALRNQQRRGQEERVHRLTS